MRKSIVTLPVILSAASLALAGCASSGTDTATDPAPDTSASPTATETTPQTYEAGEYTLTDVYSGGDATFTFPANDAPEVTPLSDHLAAINAPLQDVTYMVADLDNRNGTEKLNPNEFTMTDEEGNLYTFVQTSSLLGDYSVSMEWPDDVEDPYYIDASGTVIPEDQYDVLSSEGTDLYNDSLNGAAPGQRRTVVYAYDGSSGPLPTEFTNITMDGSVSVGDSAPSDTPSVDDVVGPELDMDAQPANITSLDPEVAESYGLVPDYYYPMVDNPGLRCAQSDPTICDTPANLANIFADNI